MTAPMKWEAAHSCKCCSGTAPLFGVVDFSKNCNERKGVVLPLSGIPIYYYRCPVCEFLFTDFFDDFSNEEMNEWIYNDGYSTVDPDWETNRPNAMAETIIQHFKQFGRDISVLDYGCGTGRLSQILRENGFTKVVNFDPMVEEFSAIPKQKFDLIVCFEVLEHVTNPNQAFQEIAGLRKENGLVVHATFLQPPEFEKMRLNWWYVGPRNGHISIHSAKSLSHCWSEVGLKVVSTNHNSHIAFDSPPEFASDVLKQVIISPSR